MRSISGFPVDDTQVIGEGFYLKCRDFTKFLPPSKGSVRKYEKKYQKLFHPVLLDVDKQMLNHVSLARQKFGEVQRVQRSCSTSVIGAFRAFMSFPLVCHLST